jgi:peptidoglycan/LPS O-acetylase OafA/YrhL
MQLEALSADRKNNLNLLRLLAASAVLFSHCFVLATGSPSAEPLSVRLGMTPGTIAVDVFFLVSGFLVTASILRSQSILDFTVARVMRIYPGLIVMLALTVFVLGASLTTLPIGEYLQSNQVYYYFFRCAAVVSGIIYQLPGVFSENPYKHAVNGSLWTLTYEIQMYALLAAGWLLCAVRKQIQAKIFGLACVAAAIFSGAHLMLVCFRGGEASKFIWLFFMFFTGAAFFVLRRRIQLTLKLALPIGILLIASGGMSRLAFTSVYLLSISYLTFYLAYVPGGGIRRYNAFGDFSYGIYIYAFPVQQATVALMPGISAGALFLWAGLATLGLSMLSWFLVEKKSIELKGRLVAWLMTRLGYERNQGLWQRTS